MKNILQYIKESEITTLSNKIKDSIDSIVDNADISDEETLKILNKVNKLIEKTGLNTDILYNNEDGGEFETRGLCISSEVKNTIIQKFDHYDNLDELVKIYNDKKTFSSKEFLKGNNLIELIKKTIGDYKLDDNLLWDLLEYVPSVNSITTGAGEILLQLFLSDMVDHNKGKGDISTKESGELEFKGHSAVMKGQGIGTPKSPKSMYKVLDAAIYDLENSDVKAENYPNHIFNNIKSITRKIEDNKDMKVLSSLDCICYQTQDNLVSYFNDVIKNYPKISSSKINACIAASILAQANEENRFSEELNKEFTNYVINTRPIVVDGHIDKKQAVRNFKMAWLTFHLKHYHKAEQFDHIVFFAKNKSTNGTYNGKYCSIEMTNDMSFNNIDSKLEEKGIYVLNMVHNSDNSRHYTPSISYIVK